MNTENISDYQPTAQQRAEEAVSELIKLKSWAKNKCDQGITVLDGYKEYETLREKYYEVTDYACDIIPTRREDYILPRHSGKMIEKIGAYISRLKEGGFYNVGKRKATVE